MYSSMAAGTQIVRLKGSVPKTAADSLPSSAPVKMPDPVSVKGSLPTKISFKVVCKPVGG